MLRPTRTTIRHEVGDKIIIQWRQDLPDWPKDKATIVKVIDDHNGLYYIINKWNGEWLARPRDILEENE